MQILTILTGVPFMGINTSYRTLASNSIKYMLKYVEEYELVKSKKHPQFKRVREFFEARELCFQNFYKLYRRYKAAQEIPELLLPIRRGPKPKFEEMPLADDSLVKQILEYRKSGLNRYVIAAALKKNPLIKKGCSESSVYRTLRKYGVSKLTKRVQEEKRKIVRTFAGSLAHIDCHYLPKGIVQSEPKKKYFVLGVIDDFSRIVWVEVIESLKAIDVTFAMMDIILHMNQRYGITFDEALTDNGAEFCSGPERLKNHPFERLLLHFAIKHRRTLPYKPQTNGKIERFWRSFDDEVIEGSIFNTIDELKDAVLGYNFYHNEHRPHQGLDGKIPSALLKESSTPV